MAYTIMGKTADMTNPQKTITDKLHKKGKIQKSPLKNISVIAAFFFTTKKYIPYSLQIFYVKLNVIQFMS